MATPKPVGSTGARPATRWILVLLVGVGGCGSSAPSSGSGGTNLPPTASISAPTLARLGQPVELDGSGSADPELGPLSYRWQLAARPVGSVAELQVTDAHAILQPDLLGSYRVTLVVNDGTQDSAPAIAQIEADDQPSLGPWQATTGLEGFSTGGAHDSAAFAWNGFMYITGGQYRSRDRIQRAPIRTDGTLGSWVDMVTLSPPVMMPVGNQDHLALVHQAQSAPNAVVYLIGGWSGGALAAVYSAPILQDGTIGTWSPGPSLNRGRHGHGGVVVGDRMYVFGGWSAGAIDLVEQVQLAANGSFVGTWTSATALPQPLTFPAGATDPASTHPGPWVLGGENPAACPNTSQATVYRAVGSPALAWQRVGTLPEPLLDLGVAFTRDTMILTGGAHRSYPTGTTNCPWKDATIRGEVHLASLDVHGELGPWRPGPDLPAPRADHSVVLYGDYMYVIGGRSVSLDPPYPTAVWFARVW